VIKDNFHITPESDSTACECDTDLLLTDLAELLQSIFLPAIVP